jgi:PIN domain nuclease of toxin-antitoxin system
MILLDTHAWFWSAAEPHRLSARATAAVRDARTTGGLGVAAISLWELAMLIARGRVEVQGSTETLLAELVETTGVIVKDLSPAVAALASQYPDDFPRDPADRLIAATARVEGAALVTKDGRLRASPFVRTIW